MRKRTGECIHSGRSYYQGVFRIVRAQNRSKRSPRIGVSTASVCNIRCKELLLFWKTKILMLFLLY